MALIIAKVLVLQCFLTLIIAARPCKNRANRETSQFNPPKIEVIQLPEAGLGDQTDSISKDLINKTCINVSHPKIPTRLALLGNTQLHSRYKIKGYPTDCNSVSGSPTTLKFDGHINKRYPICSFELNHKPRKPVTVAFLGEGSSSEYIVTLRNTSCQSSICFYPRAVYAHSVNITVNEANSKHSIKIFSDNKCKDKITHSKIKNGNDLVKITRKDNVEIKSFFITLR